MIRSLAVVGCLLVPTIFASSASAQLVRVGPWGGVRVRVPFVGVGVDVSPWGDTRVRAPFTRVEAPGNRFYSPRYRGYDDPHVYGYDDGWLPQYRYRYYRDSWDDAPPPGLPYHPHQGPVFVPPDAAPPIYGRSSDAYRLPGEPSASALSTADSPQRIAGALRSAAERLRGSLASRGEQGEIWLDYLQPARIIAAIDRGEPPQSLQPLLDNFEGATNSQVSWVIRLDGFSETRRRLAQYIAAGSAEPEAAPEQDTGPQTGEPETLELPPPAPEPRPEGADSADQRDDQQSATADSPERFSL